MPFNGVCFDMYSEPMPSLVSLFFNNGDIVHYLKAHPNVDRMMLVGTFHVPTTSKATISEVVM
jgi:hypothetical protein